MLTFLGPVRIVRGNVSRRDVLRVGSLTFAGCTLADVLRLRAAAGSPGAARAKSVIMIWLRGGASHIDSYDMKPDAPAEIRGEFRPISTNVPGISICEYLPRHAQIMDKLSIIRGIKSNDLGDHTPHYIVTGFPDRGKRPSLGSVVSYFQPWSGGLPPYVSLMYRSDGTHENSTYTGPRHRPFVPDGEEVANLGMAKGVPLDRLRDRRELLRHLDGLSRAVDERGGSAGWDVYTKQAMAMVTSPRVKEAFDVGRESPELRARYGKFCEHFLLARRLVEAGVSVVTLKVGDWDTHEKNFRDMREQLPMLDQGFHTLVMDLHERGLEKDVAVVMWGEFGRAPNISRGDGRDHWPDAGAAVIAGGGFRAGQVIGSTDSTGGRSRSTPYTPSNVIATIYRHLGIDTTATIPDFTNRPLTVLDERAPVREL